MKPHIKSILEKRVLVLDGAMGTMIQKYNLEEEDYRGDQFKDHGRTADSRARKSGGRICIFWRTFRRKCGITRA